jgi:hypothetical protein
MSTFFKTRARFSRMNHNSGYRRGLSEWTTLRWAIRVVCLFGNPKSRRVARLGRIDEWR